MSCEIDKIMDATFVEESLAKFENDSKKLKNAKTQLPIPDWTNHKSSNKKTITDCVKPSYAHKEV